MPRRIVAAPQPQVEPAVWSSYQSSSEYLAEIFHELGARGVDLDYFRGSLRQTISDIQDREACWEDRLGDLLNFRFWDLAHLGERSREIAKPRVDVYVEITTKGNLSVRWRPRLNRGEHQSPDFLGWMGHPLWIEQHAIAQRPDNELLYIREIEGLLRYTANRAPWEIEVQRRALFATRALINRIVAFLNTFFEIRAITDFVFETGESDQIIGWSLENVAAHWLDKFEGVYGLKPEVFLQRMFGYQSENGYVQDDRLSRALRKEGYEDLKPKTVGNLISRFKAYMEWPDIDWAYPELVGIWNRKGSDSG